MPHELFDKMTTVGLRAIRDGQTRAESLPREGGRWGLSLVFAPTGPLQNELAEVTAEAAAVMGEQHWQAGSHGAAHLTIRALEPHSSEPLDTTSLDRHAASTRRAARDIDPIPFEVHGLAVSPATLMACAEDVAGTAQELRHRLQVELGEDGRFENRHFANGRDPIWYVTLINLTGPLQDAKRFIEWFEANRDLTLGTEVFSYVAICRWQFDGSRMAPKVLASISLLR
jgi:hypothetical protein